MLRIVDKIGKEVGGEESLAQLAELSGNVKLAVRSEMGLQKCPEKATKDVLTLFEKEVRRLFEAKVGVRAEIDAALHAQSAFDQLFASGIQNHTPILNLLQETPEQLQTEDGLSPHAILLALIAASKAQLKLAKPNGNGHDHHLTTATNLLRFGQLVQPVTYNDINKARGYKFMNELDPNLFAHVVGDHRNGPRNNESIIKGKNVLVLGSGNGRDDLEFLRRGANEVISVDSSAIALQRIEENLNNDPMGGKKKRRLRIPKSPRTMMDTLEEMIGKAQMVDTIYSCSTLHYDDDIRFKKMMRLMRSVLVMGGHIAFTIKVPGTVFDRDQDGIKLEEEIGGSKQGDSGMSNGKIKRVRLNDDGYVRYFRDIQTILDLIEQSNQEGEPKTTKLLVTTTARQRLAEYDVPGEPAEFCYFVLTKVPA